MTRLWLYLLIFITLSCLILRLLEISVKSMQSNQDQKDKKASFYLLFEITISGILLKSQSDYRKFSRDHIKLFSYVWYIFGIMFWIFYTSFVLSFLLIEVDPINSIQELIELLTERKVELGFPADIGPYIRVY